MQVAIYTYNLATSFIFNCGILFIIRHPKCYRHTLSHYHEWCLPSTHHRGVEEHKGCLHVLIWGAMHYRTPNRCICNTLSFL